VADKTFEKIATLAAQLEVPIHMHVHETAHEIEESLKLHGVRPIERLRRLGLLSPQLIAVHAVHLEPAEIDLLAHHGCHVAHCPTSNMKLASGIPPMAAVHARGVSFGLGTDGAASNNRLDMFHEIRHAALLAKAASLDAEALGAHAVLAAATLGGAQSARPGIPNWLPACRQASGLLRRETRRMAFAALLRPGLASGLHSRPRTGNPRLGWRQARDESWKSVTDR
jgi:5-methylthioadenosine/S-adenosylhomocysteine deaminase